MTVLTLKEFKDNVRKIAEKFQLHEDSIAANEIALSVGGTEVLTIFMYDQAEKSAGVAFNVETLPEDSVQIFLDAIKLMRDLHLLPCFYINAENEMFRGIDAQIMLENDKEMRYKRAVEAALEADDEDYMEFVRFVSGDKLFRIKRDK